VIFGFLAVVGATLSSEIGSSGMGGVWSTRVDFCCGFKAGLDVDEAGSDPVGFLTCDGSSEVILEDLKGFDEVEWRAFALSRRPCAGTGRGGLVLCGFAQRKSFK
jgi:hypothetical protein